MSDPDVYGGAELRTVSLAALTLQSALFPILVHYASHVYIH